jgi:hypothetical protein
MTGWKIPAKIVNPDGSWRIPQYHGWKNCVIPHLPGLKNRCTAVSAESVATYSNQSLGEYFGGRRFTNKQSDIRLKKSKIQS